MLKTERRLYMTLEQLLELGLDEETAQKILKTFEDHLKDKYIPIERLDEASNELMELKSQIADRDNQLKELKVKATGNEELTAKITELETLNADTKKDYDLKISELKKDTAIELRLKDEKAKNLIAVRSLLDLSKVSLDGDNLIGLDEQLQTLKESESYLFGTDVIKGNEPNLGTTPISSEYKNNPWKQETFNLTAQGRIAKENPELASKLIQAAKLK